MSKPKPYLFQKGKSGNPSGKPALPKELALVNAFTVDEVARVIARTGRMTFEDLQHVIEGGQYPVLWETIANIWSRARYWGDEKKLEFLLNRAIGKAIQPVAVDFGESLPEVTPANVAALREKARQLVLAELTGPHTIIDELGGEGD
jgi:hypothetical protein